MKFEKIERYISGASRQASTILRTRYGIWLVAMISFVESALPVPLITDPFMVAYILVNRTRAILAVVVTTVASVAGGITAYLVAASFYYYAISYLSADSVAQLDQVIKRFQEGTFVATLFGAITPVPYTLVAFGAGFVQGSIWSFLAASLIGRGLRYVVVGYVTYKYGPQALERIKRNLLIFTLLSLFLFAVYLLIH